MLDPIPSLKGVFLISNPSTVFTQALIILIPAVAYSLSPVATHFIAKRKASSP